MGLGPAGGEAWQAGGSGEEELGLGARLEVDPLGRVDDAVNARAGAWHRLMQRQQTE